MSVWENTNLSNLTRRPKAKQDPATGKWLKNGARAKAGLNKAILNMSLGKIRRYSRYKLAGQGKLQILVSAAYSSQECSECRYVHEDNRPSQELFDCQRCGYTDNADHNAAKTLKVRGIDAVLDEAFTQVKASKTIRIRRKPAQEPASLGDRDNPKTPLGPPGPVYGGAHKPGETSHAPICRPTAGRRSPKRNVKPDSQESGLSGSPLL